MGMGMCEVVLDKDEDRNRYLAALDDDLCMEGHGGYPSGKLHWVSGTVYPDYDAAKEAIGRMGGTDSGFDDDYAVPFRDVNGIDAKPSAKMTALENRLAALRAKRAEYVAENHVNRRQSALVGCAACGSKVSRAYIRDDDRCPVCGKDMRSDTVRKRVSSFDARIRDAGKALSKEKKAWGVRNAKKAPVKWLVIPTWHV